MKKKFPMGTPVHLTPNTLTVEEFNNAIRDSGKCPKFGIFRVEYITNNGN